METPEVKKPSTLLFVFAAISLLAIAGCVYFLLNIDLYIYPKRYVISPSRSDVIGYGAIETIYMSVKHIKQKKGNSGMTMTVTLVPLDNKESTKELKVVLRESDGSLDDFYTNLLYWDNASQKKYNSLERPDEIKEGIFPTDTVIVRTQMLINEAGSVRVSKIQSVIR